jgi:hypothetical protein
LQKKVKHGVQEAQLQVVHCCNTARMLAERLRQEAEAARIAAELEQQRQARLAEFCAERDERLSQEG